MSQARENALFRQVFVMLRRDIIRATKTGTKPVKVNAEQRPDGAPGIHQELAARLKKLPPSVTPAQLALVVADVGRFPAAFHTVAW